MSLEQKKRKDSNPPLEQKEVILYQDENYTIKLKEERDVVELDYEHDQKDESGRKELDFTFLYPIDKIGKYSYAVEYYSMRHDEKKLRAVLKYKILVDEKTAKELLEKMQKISNLEQYNYFVVADIYGAT